LYQTIQDNLSDPVC